MTLSCCDCILLEPVSYRDGRGEAEKAVVVESYSAAVTLVFLVDDAIVFAVIHMQSETWADVNRKLKREIEVVFQSDLCSKCDHEAGVQVAVPFFAQFVDSHVIDAPDRDAGTCIEGPGALFCPCRTGPYEIVYCSGLESGLSVYVISEIKSDVAFNELVVVHAVLVGSVKTCGSETDTCRPWLCRNDSDGR